MSSTWSVWVDALKYYFRPGNLKQIYHAGLPGQKYGGVRAGLLSRKRALLRKRSRLRDRIEKIDGEIGRIDRILAPEPDSDENTK